MKIYIQQEPYKDQISIYFVDHKQDGRTYYAQPMELVFVEKNTSEYIEPTLKLHGHYARTFLPALLNALIEAGYKADIPEIGELKATKHHLDDMRKLVFKNETFKQS